jgi:[acyl-carrier-protein] S-malonyltransferase
MSLGILCPGQGDQSPGMFELVAGEPEAQSILALYKNLASGTPKDLHLNRVAQPLLCAFQLSVWQVLQKDLPEPRAFAGYSLGELSAYGCAGALAAGELIALAQHRAAAMDAAYPSPGGLAAVRGLTQSQVQQLCAKHGVEIAIINDTDRFIVGAAAGALEEFEKEAAGSGTKVTRLNVSIPSHTSAMQAAVPKFRMALSRAAWGPFAAPVLSGTTAAPVLSKAEAIEALALQIAHRVDWAACVGALVELGCTVLLELGPCNGLSRMVRDRFPHLQARSVTEFRTLRGVGSWVNRSLSNLTKPPAYAAAKS